MKGLKLKKVRKTKMVEEKHLLEKAEKIAIEILNDLKPYCEKIDICGSIRRKKEFVKDIEIVCVPKMVQNIDLFGETGEEIRDPNFIKYLYSYEVLKGDRMDGKYVQAIHPTGIKIDFFIADINNYGIAAFQRTGPADFSKYVLGYWMKRNGCYSIEGKLYKNGKQVTVENEIDFFNTIGVEYLKPEERKFPENFNFHNLDSHGYVKRMRA